MALDPRAARRWRARPRPGWLFVAVATVGLLALAPGRADGAEAAQRRGDECGSALPDRCGRRCVNLQTSETNCGSCGHACAPGQVCDTGTCVAPGPPGSQCEPACGADELCTGLLGERVCCPRERVCGGRCEAQPVVRCSGGGLGCCTAGQSCCGSGCCAAGTTCCDGNTCCAAGQSCCAGSCCGAGEVCLPDSPFRDGPYPCCPREQVCGSACCGPGRECVDGTCRPRCAQGCGAGEVCIPTPDLEAGTRNSCCPEADAWDLLVDGTWVNTVCCPAEKRWVHAQGYSDAAECCAAEDRWVRPWRDTSVGECCPPAKRCGEKCCPDGLPRCEAGVCKPAAGPPWLSPPGPCQPKATSIDVTGIILDLTTGKAVCTRHVIVCGDSLETKVVYNYRSGRCPWAPGHTITQHNVGPAVCCAEWNAAKASRQPCDPRADADCDGVANDDDREPLTPGLD